jgi:hypothetical protein
MFNSELPEVRRATSFPLLLWNTIDYLSGRVGAQSGTMTLTGQPLQFAARGESQVVSPGGKMLKTRAGAETVTSYDTNEQGIYTCRMPERRDEYRAVNLFSSRATEPLPKMQIDGSEGDVDSNASTVALTSVAAWRKRFAWQSVVVALVGLGLIEWFLFHRRVVKIG